MTPAYRAGAESMNRLPRYPRIKLVPGYPSARDFVLAIRNVARPMRNHTYIGRFADLSPPLAGEES